MCRGKNFLNDQTRNHMKDIGVKGNFSNKSQRHLAISAWADILGPTNAIRIRQLSRHSTDEVKTYIRNSEEANHAESIGLLGRIHIGSNWARTGNHLIRMDRDRMAREDLERLQSSSNRNFPIANRQPNVNLSTSHNMPNVSTFNEDDRSGAKPITTPLELASDYNDLLQKKHDAD